MFPYNVQRGRVTWLSPSSILPARPDDSGKSALGREAKFFHLGRTHHGLHRAQEDFDRQLGRNVLADESGSATFQEYLAEMTLNQSRLRPSTTANNSGVSRRMSRKNGGRISSTCPCTHSSRRRSAPKQSDGDVRRNAARSASMLPEIFKDYGFHQRRLARKTGVERFLAHGQSHGPSHPS